MCNYVNLFLVKFHNLKYVNVRNSLSCYAVNLLPSANIVYDVTKILEVFVEAKQNYPSKT